MNRDPIQEDGGPNLYGMVNNNPVDDFDILGMAGWGPIPSPGSKPSPNPDPLVNAILELLYPVKNGNPLARRLFAHYIEGSGSTFNLSSSDMVTIGANVDIRAKSRGGKSFNDYLGELKAGGKDCYKCIDVRDLKVAGGSYQKGTLGSFTITFNGKLCSSPIYPWSFTGSMSFYDYWNFDIHSTGVSERSESGKSDVAWASKNLHGKPFSVTSATVDVFQASTDPEAQWGGTGYWQDVATRNRSSGGE